MQSKDLIGDNLQKSAARVLAHIEDMRAHATVAPTSAGGCHTLWVLGHLAYIEGLVIHTFMLGRPNPLAHWEPLFDAGEPSGQVGDFPPFDEVLATCRAMRQSTIQLLDGFSEEGLDQASARVPPGWADTFGTYRLCFQYVADHGYMHRGHLADARRAANLAHMWV
ncbi:MAG: DinB family protein [Acidobacteria bacterium]|nr:DinB family protein [Acidobacteriota bacterium]